jgi:glycosyltransferase involved in cell wall biosynthesis
LPKGSYEARLAGGTDLSPHGRKEASRTLRLLGRLPRSEMAELYQWADVLVLPSISDTFGLVLLEAMSHGAPVIATENTAAPDVVREGEDGWIVPVMAPAVITARLEELTRDRERLEAMSQNAAVRARDYSVDRYAERLRSVLATL